MGSREAEGVPTFPYPPSPISHHWTNASRGNYLGDFWNYSHCLVSTGQPQNPELSTLTLSQSEKSVQVVPTQVGKGMAWVVHFYPGPSSLRIGLP